jgi:uncharacterized C2H2 Zn-finger protein
MNQTSGSNFPITIKKEPIEIDDILEFLNQIPDYDNNNNNNNDDGAGGAERESTFDNGPESFIVKQEYEMNYWSSSAATYPVRQEIKVEVEIIDVDSIPQRIRWPLEPAIVPDWKCHVCLKTFSRKFSLCRHMLIHTGEKPFQCPYCTKAFNQKGDLGRHVTIHTGERDFRCHLCMRNFNTKKNLQYHLVAHSDLRPYACTKCPKAFKVKRLLQYHEGLHTTKRAFNCDICGMSFVAKPYVTSHMRVHIEARPYSCSVCDLKFKRPYDVKFHMTRKHGVHFQKVKPEIVVYKNFIPRAEFINPNQLVPVHQIKDEIKEEPIDY